MWAPIVLALGGGLAVAIPSRIPIARLMHALNPALPAPPNMPLSLQLALVAGLWVVSTLLVGAFLLSAGPFLVAGLVRATRLERALFRYLLQSPQPDASPLFLPIEVVLKRVPSTVVASVTQQEWDRAPAENAVTMFYTVPDLIHKLAPSSSLAPPGLIRHALRSPDREIREAAICWLGNRPRAVRPSW